MLRERRAQIELRRPGFNAYSALPGSQRALAAMTLHLERRCLVDSGSPEAVLVAFLPRAILSVLLPRTAPRFSLGVSPLSGTAVRVLVCFMSSFVISLRFVLVHLRTL
ncbi:hypothetical protein DFH09DRAFT_1330758 [Mycena vulgaris]|nr:hypothetical protein DFH09DRAFT_1330758 [Mycena vulgaris]